MLSSQIINTSVKVPENENYQRPVKILYITLHLKGKWLDLPERKKGLKRKLEVGSISIQILRNLEQTYYLSNNSLHIPQFYLISSFLKILSNILLLRCL